MSILIKGMNMPTDGNETIIRIQPDGTVLDQYGHHLAIAAVPVPSHGRLIDADALDSSETDYFGNHLVYLVDIDDAPTIIPASEEEVK